jgi:hypothetical protein
MGDYGQDTQLQPNARESLMLHLIASLFHLLIANVPVEDVL